MPATKTSVFIAIKPEVNSIFSLIPYFYFTLYEKRCHSESFYVVVDIDDSRGRNTRKSQSTTLR
jgi:hypothetical protein